MTDDPDRLMRRVASGDREAFARLYAHSAPKLFGIALRITRNRDVAEDAFQDALVQIWRQAARYDRRRGTVEAWMVTIVRSRSLDRVRRLGVDRRRTADGDPEAAMDMLGALDVRGGEDGAALRQCLERLDEDERRMVLEAYCLGLSREELADRLDRPVNTVKTQLRRALKRLRGCLDE